MRERRVFTDQPLRVGVGVCLGSSESRHVLKVLRLGVDEPLVLFNGDGHDYGARLLGAKGAVAEASVERQGPREPDARLSIRLAIGVSKGDRMDFAIQKSVELGVSEVVPLFTERSVVRLGGDRLRKREAHWRGVMVAACEQSGRRRIPVLAPVERLEDWLSLAGSRGVLLDHRADRSLMDLPRPDCGLTLLIGPEGGLSGAERERALSVGFQGVRLGPRVLRTETAPLAAIAIAQAIWGDLGSES